jgi:hypothetical protein
MQCKHRCKHRCNSKRGPQPLLHLVPRDHGARIPPQPMDPPSGNCARSSSHKSNPRLFNPPNARTTRMASPLRPASVSSPAPAPSAAAVVPNVTCCLCPNEFPSHEVLAFIACCGPEAHVFCNDCFSGMVSAQVSAEGKVSFIQRGLKIECALCM